MVDSSLCSPGYDRVRPRLGRRFGLASVAQILVVTGVVCSFCVSAVGQFVGYVANTNSNSVTIFGTQLTTQAAPLSNSNTDNVLQVLDKSTGWNAPVRVAILGDIPESSTNSIAFITSQGDNGLWAIDTKTQLSSRSATATNINTGANPLKLSQPGGIAIATASTAGVAVRAAYVVNEADGTVSIINVDPSSASKNTLIANIATITPSASSSTIPEAAAAGGLVFLIENSPSASLWYIDTSSPTLATRVTLPRGTGTLTGLNAFQLLDSSAILHTFVATSDSTNGAVIVIDATDPASLAPVVVPLGQGTSPVSLVSAPDLTTTDVQDLYIADTVAVSTSAYPIWNFTVDCSSTQCSIPGSTGAQQATFVQASPISIGITPDGQQVFVTEGSSPGIENYCVSGSSCSEAGDNVSDTTVGSGPTGIVVSDISAGSAPLCWFTATGVPAPTAIAVPTSVCNSISCNSNNSALGACAQSRNLAAATITLNFQDIFGCVPFGTTGSPTPTCSAQGGLGGQTLYDVAGVFTTVIAQTNSVGPGSISARTQVSSDVTIQTQPASQTINTGATATLTVAAVSANQATITYQWYLGISPNGSAITGATASSYTTPALNATTNYWVQVNDGTGPVNSSTAVITVNTPPAIATQPQDQSVLQGASATLSVVATGTPAPSYQWYQGASGDTTNLIEGATAASFTTPVLNTVGQIQYWVRATNSLGHADSNTATVTVTQAAVPPSITTQPASQTITAGQSATLTVVASGTSLTYQWYQGTSGITTSLISGATASSYTTPALNSTTNYWVRVSNSVGQADSNTATITVNNPITVTPPSTTTISAGQSLMYTISLNSGGSAVSLSCQPQPPSQSLPTGVNCLFSPTQIAVGQTSQLTIATTGPTASLRLGAASGLFYALIFPLPVFGLFMTLQRRRLFRRNRFLRIIYPSLLLLTLIGCGTNPKPVPTPAGAMTPPGVYTVLVVGTNTQNQVVATTSVTFTVH